MKILLVSESFLPKTGGIENLMANIAELSSHDIDVLAETSQGATDKDFEFEVIRKDFSGYLGFLKKSLFIARKSSDYDKIYISTSANGFVVLPSKLLGKDIISHAHGRELFIKIVRKRTYLRKLLFWTTIKSIDKFIAVSQWTRNRLKKIGVNEEDIHIIHNGVDFERFNSAEPLNRSEIGLDEKDFVVITVSRLDPRKGHSLILRALKNLDKDIKYVVAGSGEEENRLKQLAEDLGVENRVRFVGYVPDDKLASYYNMADLFVMPSERLENGNVEGFGISFLEANASGLPVIGSNTGGIPSAIQDNKTGFLCPPEVDEIRKKITKVKEDEELKEKLSKNAIEWAEKHDWEKVIPKIDKVISKS